MAFRPPPLYPLTDRRLAGRPHDAQVAVLAAAGARLLQLRDKEAPSADLLRAVDACQRVASEAGALLVLNDRADLAQLAGCGGVHLGEEDLPLAAARALLGPVAVLGASSHDAESAARAEAEGADYVAFGPIYPTGTKADAGEAMGLARLREVRRAVRGPLVAIGGITLERAPEVLEAGADSVAVIRDLAASPHPGERLLRWHRHLEIETGPPRGLIFLTGFMGAGKTTVGQLLAERLGRRFVDLDAAIESRRGMTVTEIFARHGEAAFRDEEEAILRAIPPGGDAVLALGGGSLQRAANLERVVSLGTLVWLDVPLETAAERAAIAGSRPLLTGGGELASLLQARLSGYRRAHLRLRAGSEPPEAVAAAVERHLARPPGA